MSEDEIIDNIASSCYALGEVDLSGIRLDSADKSLLDVTQMTLDEHVAMQPSAIAFYTSLLCDAQRRLKVFERQYNRWQVKKKAEAKAVIKIDKPTLQDIEARFLVDNADEIEKWDKTFDKLQERYDTLRVWVEAWKQKSFSIKEHVSMTDNERYNSNESTSEGKRSEDVNFSRVRGIIRGKH